MHKFRTLQLATDLFHKAKSIQLRNPYRDQFHRALFSIPLNLAEGSAKESNRDRRRYYEIALGSLREVQVIIELLKLEHIKKDADRLGASLYKLCKSLRPENTTET